MFLRSVNSHIFSGSIISNLIIEGRQFRYLDEVAETILRHNVIGHIELEVGSLLCKDCRPRVKASDILTLQLVGPEILEQQIQFSKRVTDCCTRQECRSQILTGSLLNGTDCVEKIERTL